MFEAAAGTSLAFAAAWEVLEPRPVSLGGGGEREREGAGGGDAALPTSMPPTSSSPSLSSSAATFFFFELTPVAETPEAAFRFNELFLLFSPLSVFFLLF